MGEVVVAVPKVGLTVTEVEVTGWFVAVGDRVDVGQLLAEVDADKATIAIEAEEAGTVAEIVAAVRSVVPVGGPLARLTVERAASAAAERITGPITEPITDPITGPSAMASEDSSAGPSSPAARRLGRELGVDVRVLRGTGPGGRVVERDVRAVALAGATVAVTDARVAGEMPGFREVPSSPARRATFRRMAQSHQQTAPASLQIAVDARAALARQHAARAQGVRATLNHVVVHATIAALVEHPLLNAIVLDDRLLTADTVDVAFAVDVDGDLLAPVVHDVARADLATLVERMQGVVDRVRAGQATAKDLTGGTFTVSNLGMFGIESFRAVINPPQVAILGVGSAVDEAVVVDGGLHVLPRMRLTLTFDHRVVDGAPAARFLSTLRAHLERSAD